MKIILKYLFSNPEEQLLISDATGIDFAIYQGFNHDKLTDLLVATKVFLSLKIWEIRKETYPDFSRCWENYSSNKIKYLISLPVLIAELFPQNAFLIIASTLGTKAAGCLKLGNPRQIKFSTSFSQNSSIVANQTIFIFPRIAVFPVKITNDYQNIKLEYSQKANIEIVIRRRIVDNLIEQIKLFFVNCFNLFSNQLR